MLEKFKSNKTLKKLIRQYVRTSDKCRRRLAFLKANASTKCLQGFEELKSHSAGELHNSNWQI
ncbi:MAG: hypothetical protein PHR96_03205 [Clostridia bacterium]|nr:hypothetical protein [Clostridia bacterium]